MKSLLSIFSLCATLTLLFSENFPRDYTYLSIGAYPSFSEKDIASSLGAGYRINFQKAAPISGLDVHMNFVRMFDPDVGYKQIMLPRVLLLKNIPYSFYMGAGGSYLEAEQYKSINYIFNGHPLKTKRRLQYKGMGANFAVGYKLWETKTSINFCQYEVVAPVTYLFNNKKDADFVSISLSAGVGF